MSRKNIYQSCKSCAVGTRDFETTKVTKIIKVHLKGSAEINKHFKSKFSI